MGHDSDKLKLGKGVAFVKSQLRRLPYAAKEQADLPQSPMEATYPTVARFVQTHGWIEIGDQEGVGFVVRALDCGGMVFETQKPKTLTEAMVALEKGIAKFLWKPRKGTPCK